MRVEVTTESLKATPPIAVSLGAALGSLHLNDVVLLATLVYIGLQAGYLIWKWRAESNRNRRNRRRDD